MSSFERNQLSSSEKFGPLGTLKKNMPWKLIGYTYLLNYYDGFEIRHNSLGYMKYAFLSALSNLVLSDIFNIVWVVLGIIFFRNNFIPLIVFNCNLKDF